MKIRRTTQLLSERADIQRLQNDIMRMEYLAAIKDDNHDKARAIAREAALYGVAMPRIPSKTDA